MKAERKFHFYCVRCEKRTEHVKVALDYICTICENQESIELEKDLDEAREEIKKGKLTKWKPKDQ